MHLIPLTHRLHLLSVVKFGRAGAFLLSRSSDLSCLTFVFGFDISGISHTLEEIDAEALALRLEGILTRLPKGERLTWRLESKADHSVRETYLQDLSGSRQPDGLRFLAADERRRLRSLTQNSNRQQKRLRLYVTATYAPERDIDGDWLDKTLHFIGQTDWMQRLLKTTTRRMTHAADGILHPSLEKNYVEAACQYAFRSKLPEWTHLLFTSGLSPRHLSAEEMWADIWARFNAAPPQPLPQLWTWHDETGKIQETINDSLHATSRLIGDNVPYAAPHYVKVRGRYTAILYLFDKPDGWADTLAQLRYLQDWLDEEGIVCDYDIITELEAGNDFLHRVTLQRQVRHERSNQTRAFQQNTVDAAAEMGEGDALAAQTAMLEGSRPLYVAATILLHAETLQALEYLCGALTSRVAPPARLVRETDVADKTWLETLPITDRRLLSSPYNRRQVYLSHEVPGLLPVFTESSARHTSSYGLELITDPGKEPITLDMVSEHRHLSLYAATRSGKSVLVAGLIANALMHQIPAVIIDFPKADGTSTFTDYADFLQGAYFNIAHESINIFEPPNLNAFSQAERDSRMQDFRDFLIEALCLVLGGGKEVSQQTRVTLGLALTRFYSHVQGVPTLADFLTFLSARNSEEWGDTASIRQGLSWWLTTRMGKALSTPTSLNLSSPLTVFSLTSLRKDDDAALMAMAAQAASLQLSLKHPKSILFIDESPILFDFPSIARMIGRLCANGAKAGIRVVLAGQDPDTIARSVAGSKILQNMSTRLIGRIQPAALSSYVDLFRYDPALIRVCADAAFVPNTLSGYSRWFLDDGERKTFCRYYPGKALLSIVANNPEEVARRQQLIGCGGNIYMALAHMAYQQEEVS